MDIINIAICDDNIEHINILEKYLFEISEITVRRIECDAYQSGEAIVNAYENNIERYDVVFMDMEMNKLNGIETANLIREFDENMILIFVTSHTEYMRESFKCLPFRFLIKPIDREELNDVFVDICKKLGSRKKVFSFTENKALIRLCCEDIIFCECRDHWVYVYVQNNKNYKICKPLSEIYEKLDESMFCRVHSSFIVNFRYVNAIKNNSIELQHYQSSIPISRLRKKTVIEKYTAFVERNLFI